VETNQSALKKIQEEIAKPLEKFSNSGKSG
jgi:hypothetical protein